MAEAGVLRRLLIKIGFVTDDKDLQKTEARLDKLLSKMVSFGAVLGGLRGGFKLITDQIKEGNSLKLFAARLGLTTQEVQKFGYIAAQVGVPIDELQRSFRVLMNQVGSSGTLTGMSHSIKLFGQYGLSVRGARGEMLPLSGMLEQVADRMSKMDSQAMKVRLATELFGAQGYKLIPILEKGSVGIRDLFGDFDRLNLTMRSGFVDAAQVAFQKMVTLRTAFKVFKSELAYGAFPWFNRLVSFLTIASSWMTAFARKTTLATTIWAAGGALALVTVIRLAGGFTKLFTTLLRFSIPLLIIGALYLIFDDLYALLTGKESVIGDVLKEMYGAEGAAKWVEELRVAWADLGKVISEDVWPLFKSFFKWVLDLIPAMMRRVVQVINAIKDVVGWVKEKLLEDSEDIDARMNLDAREEAYRKQGWDPEMARKKALELYRNEVANNKLKREHRKVWGNINPNGFDNEFGASLPASLAPKTAAPKVGPAGPKTVNNTVNVKIEGNADKEVMKKSGSAINRSLTDLSEANDQAGGGFF